MTNVFIGNIAYSIGSARDISHIFTPKNENEKCQSFKDMGMSNYLVTEKHSVDLAFESIAKTLEASDLDPAEIDAIVYCTENAADGEFYKKFASHCEQVGLTNAYPVGIFMSGCGNFGSGINVASQFLKAGQCRNILLTTVYTAPGDDERLMEPAVGVLSDGSASCILSTRELEYKLEYVHVLAKNDLGCVSPSEDYLRYSLENYAGRKQIFETVYEATGLTPDDMRGLITNNYGWNTLRGFASESGIPLDRLFSANLPVYGHVQSSDILINLYCENSNIQAGEKLLFLSTGPTTWVVGLIVKA